MSEQKDGKRMVLVNEEYLAFMHDELAENHARLKETLGESGAAAVFDWCADRLVRTSEKGKYSFHPIDAVVRRVSGWGMQLRVKEVAGKVEVEVQCPYAEGVHPRLSSSSPKCPLGEYVLGAVRLEDEKSQLVSNRLTPRGSKFTIQNR